MLMRAAALQRLGCEALQSAASLFCVRMLRSGGCIYDSGSSLCQPVTCKIAWLSVVGSEGQRMLLVQSCCNTSGECACVCWLAVAVVPVALSSQTLVRPAHLHCLPL